MKKVKDLEQAINEKRMEMVAMGMTKGLSSEETIHCSQELDNLINDYNRTVMNQGRRKSLVFVEEFLISLQKEIDRWIRMHYHFFIPMIKK